MLIYTQACRHFLCIGKYINFYISRLNKILIKALVRTAQ
jgi:hypothetical protein